MHNPISSYNNPECAKPTNKQITENNRPKSRANITNIIKSNPSDEMKILLEKTSTYRLLKTRSPSSHAEAVNNDAVYNLFTRMTEEYEEEFFEVLTEVLKKGDRKGIDDSSATISTALLVYCLKSGYTNSPLELLSTLDEKPGHLKTTSRGRKKVFGKLTLGDNTLEEDDLKHLIVKAG